MKIAAAPKHYAAVRFEEKSTKKSEIFVNKSKILENERRFFFSFFPKATKIRGRSSPLIV